MAYSINIPANSSWSVQTVTLDGSKYDIELRYKERTDRWYVSLFDVEGNTLLREKKCVGGQTLTGLFEIEGFTGNLMVERKFGKEDYPTYDNFGFGKPFELLYLTTEEFDILLETAQYKDE